MIALLGEILKLIKEDKQSRLEQFKVAKKKMDEEDIEYFHEDLKKVDKIEGYVMEVYGVLVHVYGGQISQATMQHLLPHFAAKLIKLSDSADYEILNAVCFLCDSLEYGGQDLFDLTA